VNNKILKVIDKSLPNHWEGFYFNNGTIYLGGCNMGMNMSEKILAKHAGLDAVEAGQLIICDLDMVLANDITAGTSGF